ncbi:recombinase family protein [Brachybacterium sp. ACRRE]|uniref:recombinase family protein n=1 Tax=Brachybacterium sp. ACRRE TaxID=2918184 RepID=UPI001EF2FD84|nr:recombinase family protein [Brachybacterium sp. ACRRE]MCG7311078.1 recombinase family protein [Brachybacterium sp. ACRRE]
MVAEFVAVLICMRTRGGTAVARAKDRIRGKQPKLPGAQRGYLATRYRAGGHIQAGLAGLFNISRTTVHREIQRGSALIPTV